MENMPVIMATRGVCVCAFSLCSALILLPSASAHALVSYGAARPQSPLSATDITADYEPSVASIGASSWIVVWTSYDDLGGTLPAGVPHGFAARSDDDGETWSFPVLLSGGRASSVDVESDRAGVAVVAAGNLGFDDGGPFVELLRTNDGGLTWTSVATFGPPLPIFPQEPTVVTDYAGTWVVSFSAGGWAQGTESDLFFARSIDNGISWSSLAPLNTDADVDLVDDGSLRIATDGSGAWLAVWRRNGAFFTATSPDNGATWTPPIVGPSPGAGDHGIATDNAGRWLITWASVECCGPPVIYVSESTDSGTSWSAATPVHGPIDGDYVTFPRLVHAGGPVWDLYGLGVTATLRRTIGYDSDPLHSRSFDGGVSWTEWSALTKAAVWDEGRANGANDADVEGDLDFATDGLGRWLAVWHSHFDFVPDFGLGNGIGDDADVVITNAFERCSPSPTPSCTATTSAKGDRIILKAADGGGHKLTWTLKKGAVTTTEDLGDPAAGSTSYALCIYDDVGGNPMLVIERDLRAGAIGQEGAVCWGTKASTLSYKDKSRRNGAVSQFRLTSGPEGKSKLKLTAGGPTLALPPMPFSQSPEVIVQLINTENGRCWESRFDTALVNTPSIFSAR